MTSNGVFDLEKEFNEKAEKLAQYQLAFDSQIEDLRPNQIKRAFTAVMKYPVPNDRPATTDTEHNLTVLGIAISELKTEMATISAAIQQLGGE